jgi:hypothetical protein
VGNGGFKVARWSFKEGMSRGNSCFLTSCEIGRS